MFWWFKKKTVDESKEDARIDEIRALLFPPLVTEEHNEQTYHVDRSIDANLAAALVDLEEGYSDDITEESIRNALKVLEKVRRILVTTSDIPADATYLVVAPPDIGLTDGP